MPAQVEQQLGLLGMAPRFQDSEYMSAKEKDQVLKAWERFIVGGFKRKDFTKALYHHLYQGCSFIAHYDIEGFYSTYFRKPSNTVQFLQQFDRDYGLCSAEYGDSWWIRHSYWVDINLVMVDALEPYKAGIYRDLAGMERRQDLAVAQALLAKHGLALKGG